MIGKIALKLYDLHFHHILRDILPDKSRIKCEENVTHLGQVRNAHKSFSRKL
jgi:hypothetical protein